MSASPPKRGGPRPGAGRPALGVRRLNVTLDEQTLARLREIGGGNVSEGIRRAVQDRTNDKSPGP